MAMPAKQKALYLLWGVAALALTYAAWGFGQRYLGAGGAEGLIGGSGRIEGTEVTVATKAFGRIERLFVKEGERVEKGQLLVVISSDQLQAQLESVLAEAAASERQVKREEENVRFWESKVEEARVGLKLATREAAGRIDQAKASLEAAEADLVRTEADLERTRKDLVRYEALYQEKGIPLQVVDHAKAAKRASEAQGEGAKKEVERAQATFRLAEAGQLIVSLRERELQSALAMCDQAKEALPMAQAGVKAAKARVREVEAALGDMRIVSPASGTIIAKLVEEGEVVTPGSPLLTLVDLDDLFLKIYIPEPEIGKITLGSPARIRVDAFPNRFFEAVVSEIAQQAEFTPRFVETKEERAKLTFWVKLRARNPQGLLKPGMPAEGVILWKEGASWKEG
ncbi:MAG: efflux RND transporter periplasmic adaptor subunit [candidate division NC10 bacterium]|nr:efflux RND transporter periplasmic adaptor subunit [candidate division NC10 bacterium]